MEVNSAMPYRLRHVPFFCSFSRPGLCCSASLLKSRLQEPIRGPNPRAMDPLREHGSPESGILTPPTYGHYAGYGQCFFDFRKTEP